MRTVVFLSCLCLASASLMRTSRIDDSRSLLTARQQHLASAFEACTGPANECPAGCIDEEDCPINQYKKELDEDCKKIAKEIVKVPTDNTCDVTTDAYSDCEDQKDEGLKDQGTETEDYCDCVKEVTDCEAEKKKCCDDAKDVCGPWKIDDGVCPDCKVTCDWGDEDKATDDKFYETCVTELTEAFNQLKLRLLNAQNKVNGEKKTCNEKKECCNKDCDDGTCVQKCKTIEGTKTTVCGIYNKCTEEKKKELVRVIGLANTKAQAVSDSLVWIAERNCEIRGKAANQSPDAVDKCKAGIDKKQCPAVDCKIPDPKPCDDGNPASCENTKNYAAAVCGGDAAAPCVEESFCPQGVKKDPVKFCLKMKAKCPCSCV